MVGWSSHWVMRHFVSVGACAWTRPCNPAGHEGKRFLGTLLLFLVLLFTSSVSYSSLAALRTRRVRAVIALAHGESLR